MLAQVTDGPKEGEVYEIWGLAENFGSGICMSFGFSYFLVLGCITLPRV